MNYKIYSSLILYSFSVNVFCQQLISDKITPINNFNNDEFNFSKFLGKHQNNWYYICYKNENSLTNIFKSYYINSFCFEDGNLAIKPILLFKEDKLTNFLNVLLLENNALLLSYIDNKRNNTFDIYSQKINFNENISLAFEKNKIGEVPYKTPFKELSNLIIKPSLSNKCFIKLEDRTKAISIKEGFNIGLYDEQGNQIWKKIIPNPFKKSFYYISDLILSDQGNIVLCGSQSINKLPLYAHEKVTMKEKTILICYYKDSLNFQKIHTPSYESNILMEPILSQTNNGDFIATGFISKDHKINHINGMYIMEIENGNGALTKQVFIDFKDSLLSLYLNEKDLNKYKNGLDNMIIKNIFFNENNDILIISEQYSSAVGGGNFTNNSSGTKTYNPATITYYLNDIFVFCFDKEYKLKWLRLIPKSQNAINSITSQSFYCVFIRNKLFLCFNDLTENHGVVKDEHTDNIEFILYSLDENGGIDKSFISNSNGTQKLIVYPNTIIKSDNEWVGYCVEKNKLNIPKNYTFRKFIMK